MGRDGRVEILDARTTAFQGRLDATECLTDGHRSTRLVGVLRRRVRYAGSEMSRTDRRRGESASSASRLKVKTIDRRERETLAQRSRAWRVDEHLAARDRRSRYAVG